MNSKEKFIGTCRFDKRVEPPYWDTIGFWDGTIERWHSEGLPRNNTPYEYFGMTKIEYLPVVSRTDLPLLPLFEKKIINEGSETIIYLNGHGATLKEYKKSPERSMPQWLEFPVKKREDFENLKFRLDPNSKERYPDWNEVMKIYSNRDSPLGLTICGAYGFQRELLGMENLAYKYYDEPDFIEEITKYWFDFQNKICEVVLSNIDIDYIYIWEDMAYKNGPLISPAMFKKFIFNHYKNLIDNIKRLGCNNILVDSDGNNYSLMPLFIEAGVNGFMPIEVAAGMDPIELRHLYGSKVWLWGGIDKRILSKSKKDIEKEVLKKLPELLKFGGYIPAVDHTIPPDVPFNNYVFFIELLRKLTKK